jgi:hypothetical protein
VQGEGSYVKAREIIFEDARKALEARDKSDLEQTDAVIELIVNSLVGWDWVDFDGNLLPLPQTADELRKMLTMGEVQFLTKALVARSETDAKN